MAMNPLATRRVMHQQQLRQAVGRALRGDVPPPPPALRQALLEKLSHPAPAQPVRPAPNLDDHRYRIGWLGRWLPLAAAAVLFGISLTTLYYARQQPPSPANLGATPVLAPALVDKFAWRHNGCAREIQQLNDAVAFPSDLKQMPTSLAEYLGAQSYPVLDLSAIGYDFWKAGECIVPGHGIHSVHMIYRSRGSATGEPAGAALSLWVATDKGQVSLKPDQPYVAAGGDKPHPMIVWRHSGLVYYLMGDSLDSVDQAAGLLRSRG
jgi:hypothetical protein